MKKSYLELEIEPNVLKYARFKSGYALDEVAKKSKIKREILEKAENEKISISVAKVEKLAVVYKIPLAYFLLKEKPKDVLLPKDFRIIYDSGETEFSPKVMMAFRKARYVQSIAKELNRNGYKYNFQPSTLESDVDKLADYFRKIIKVPFSDQKKWSNPAVALSKWKEAIENIGILIMQSSMRGAHVSAFSLVDTKPYVILLNSSEHEHRRIFSLFHEIGHILLNQSGVCNLNNLSRNSYQYVQIEKFCNQFAASVLVPEELFQEEYSVQKLLKQDFKNWRESEIRDVARLFRVSKEVIYRRFLSVGKIDEQEYEHSRNFLNREFEEYKKKGRKNPPRIPQYRKIISSNGREYSSLVLDSLHSNHITLADAASFLDTSTRHISAVEYNI